MVAPGGEPSAMAKRSIHLTAELSASNAATPSTPHAPPRPGGARVDFAGV